MTTNAQPDYNCQYRGKVSPQNHELFNCSIHGRCTVFNLYPRIRACCECSDLSNKGFSSHDREHKLLGDQIEGLLTSVGITKERVTNWLGVECDCEERRMKLNMLHTWVRRVVSGKLEKAKEYLEEILT